MPQDDTNSSRTSAMSVLFADVSGSTSLYEALGDREASRVIGRCLQQMDAAAQVQQGQTIEIIGDEILVIFPTPLLAVEAATDMMRRIDLEPPAGGRRMALRIGCHHGHVLLKSGDPLRDRPTISGDTVNTAARIVALAKSRQILISASIRTLLPAHWQKETRSLDVFSLKGKSADMQIFELIWQEQEDITALGTLRKPTQTIISQLSLRHMEQQFTLDESRSKLSMGREAIHDVVMDDRCVSRQHAVIERRRDKFVLIDKSTNGTYVTFEGKNEILLHMEEVILYGKGHISLGRSHLQNAPGESLEFEVLSPGGLPGLQSRNALNG
jgi:class 3 adenylate cyclase